MQPVLKVIKEMHSYRRPAGSNTEHEFIARYVSSLPGAWCDPFDNWHVIIGESPILWSCHTDTIHRAEGRQRVHLSQRMLLTVNYADRALSVWDRHTQQNMRITHGDSTCLGADDTAGVFLCCEMVKAGVPGHYVFHYGEERGGIGSSRLAGSLSARRRYEHDYFAELKCAIAFDRRGTRDIITHQYGNRTASDAFTLSLARGLNINNSLFNYSPCEGVFTDTANYTDVIGECSNISVGYQHEHCPDESLDVTHLLALRDALIHLDQSALEFVREPMEEEAFTWSIKHVDIEDIPECAHCGDSTLCAYNCPCECHYELEPDDCAQCYDSHTGWFVCPIHCVCACHITKENYR